VAARIGDDNPGQFSKRAPPKALAGGANALDSQKQRKLGTLDAYSCLSVGFAYQAAQRWRQRVHRFGKSPHHSATD